MVDVVKLTNGGDWEALYVDGDRVASGHLGRIDVLSHLEGLTVDSTTTSEVFLPDGEYEYPTSLAEVIEDDRYAYGGEN